MRIIAGSAKGRQLRSLRGRALRPTADRVRESLFAMLEARVPEARFLDLYAGSGAVGLEALSRGAAEAVLVEFHRPAARVIEENASRCGLSARARVLCVPTRRGLERLEREGASFSIIFADPPYGTGEALAIMGELGRRPGLVAEAGLVVCQHSRREELPEQMGGLRRMRTASFGETVVDFYERCGRETPPTAGRAEARP